jgi:hypothetical protein
MEESSHLSESAEKPANQSLTINVQPAFDVTYAATMQEIRIAKVLVIERNPFGKSMLMNLHQITACYHVNPGRLLLRQLFAKR